ncbi:NACHT, LRR and PYD domains-containing protein 12, partial [Ophiophagus hannah]
LYLLEGGSILVKERANGRFPKLVLKQSFIQLFAQQLLRGSWPLLHLPIHSLLRELSIFPTHTHTHTPPSSGIHSSLSSKPASGDAITLLPGGFLTKSCSRHLEEVFKRNQRLEKLELSLVNADGTAVEFLCAGLQHPDCKVKELQLSEESLTESFSRHLAEVLQKNQGLRMLKLFFKNTDDRAAEMLCEVLQCPECKIKEYKSLTESFSRPLAEVLRKNQTLREFELFSNNIDDRATEILNEEFLRESCGRHIAGVLRINQTLRELYVFGDCISDNEEKLLCEELKHSGAQLPLPSHQLMELTSNWKMNEKSEKFGQRKKITLFWKLIINLRQQNVDFKSRHVILKHKLFTNTELQEIASRAVQDQDSSVTDNRDNLEKQVKKRKEIREVAEEQEARAQLDFEEPTQKVLHGDNDPGVCLMAAIIKVGSNKLLEKQFKEFKWRLNSINYDGKPNIPRTSLDKADQQEVVDLLIQHCGEDALEVCIDVLRKCNRNDLAKDLEENKVVDAQQLPVSSDYRNYIKQKFATIKDPNAVPGENVPLNQRYSKLIILDYHPSEEEREDEILAIGKKHLEIISKRAESSNSTETLFNPDKYGLIPQVVVLQGAAGIGKTMMAKKIMFDWASQQLYQDKFNYVFYISCSEMNLHAESQKTNIAEVISNKWLKCHKVNYVIQNILKDEEKLLFIIDGFDELRYSFDQPENYFCIDPWKKEPVRILLRSLFQKNLLPKSSLIITTRPMALEKLHRCLRTPMLF